MQNEIPDEFTKFVNASIHPPNELSIPRCHIESSQESDVLAKKSRSLGSPFNSQTSLCSNRSLSPSPRPSLRRESAQDFDDEDINPNISIEIVGSNDSPPIKDDTSSPFVARCPSYYRSAPGTPLRQNNNSFKSYTRPPSRGDSDESGYLRVPLSRTRGVSLPDSMEDSFTASNSYLLREFEIKGGKVVHVGNYQRISGSNNSINSVGSRG